MSKPRRRSFAAGSLAALAGLFAFAAAVAPGLGSDVVAQQPPGPMLEVSGSIQIEGSPRQYDLLQLLVEFPPGASTLPHRVNGRAIFTVLSGQITRIETEGGHSTVFKAGETYRETAEDHFDVDVNNADEPARLLATFLLDLGAAPLIFDPDARPSDAPGTTIVAMARTSVGRQPAQFTLSHSIFVNEPGGVVPPHTHDGWVMTTTLEGKAVTLLDGEVQTSATFVKRPGVVHEGNNPGPGRVRVMVAALNPLGAPPARLVAADAGQTPAIQPPSTGNGGLSAGR